MKPEDAEIETKYFFQFAPHLAGQVRVVVEVSPDPRGFVNSGGAG